MSDVHQKFILEAVQARPEVEVCGLMGGVWQGQTAVVRQVVPVENISPTPAARYQMHPKTQSETILAFDKRGWQVVGIYHSHPRGEAVPSSADIAEAAYSDAVYLIGLPTGELTAWQILHKQVFPVKILIDG
ncbi:MAG: M67 family metallopeptidase [Anaerolineae bacterium]|nr:M67 family metallopeptidase [Anaerolineae bacterium]